MTDKDAAKLEPLFHDRAKFVHMGGTWKKAEELDIIKSGRIGTSRLMSTTWRRKCSEHGPCLDAHHAACDSRRQ